MSGRMFLALSTIAASLPHNVNAQSIKVDAEPSRSWHARLPGDETAPLKHLHHLVDTRRRDQEVPLDVRLGGWSAEATDVLGDEGEVLELSLGGAQQFIPYRGSAWTLHTGDESCRASFNDQSSTIEELDSQLLRTVNHGVRHLAVLQTVCD